MAQASMEIVLSEDLQRRIYAAAERQSKTSQEFIQEALYTYVEDIEDGVMSDVVLSEEGLNYLLPEREAQVAVDYPVLETGRKDSLKSFHPRWRTEFGASCRTGLLTGLSPWL